MFIAALFIISKAWTQSKCPLTDEWIRKMLYMYINKGILLSHKKNEVMPLRATWMDLEIIILTQTEKENIKGYLLSVESKEKKDTYDLTPKTETDSQLWKKAYGEPSARRGERD